MNVFILKFQSNPKKILAFVISQGLGAKDGLQKFSWCTLSPSFASVLYSFLAMKEVGKNTRRTLDMMCTQRVEFVRSFFSRRDLTHDVIKADALAADRVRKSRNLGLPENSEETF